MQAIAFLLFAAGCLVAIHTIEVWWQRRNESARRPHARPMTNREFRDTYYAGVEEEW